MEKETRSNQSIQPRIEPIEKVHERRMKVSDLLFKRKKLKERIGIEGKVQIGSSEETTFRIGRVRSRVEDSIQRLTIKKIELDKEIARYNKVGDYFEMKKIKQSRLAELSELVHRDRKKNSELKYLQKDFEEFILKSEKDRYLKKGIERTRQEEEQTRTKKAEATAKRTPAVEIFATSDPDKHGDGPEAL
jgi:hypothetical protein